MWNFYPPFKISLNMLRFHQILRPHESFHTFLLFSPINLTNCYKVINLNFFFSFGYWQTICCYTFMILVIIRMKVLSDKRMKLSQTITSPNKGSRAQVRS